MKRPENIIYNCDIKQAFNKYIIFLTMCSNLKLSYLDAYLHIADIEI